MIKILKATIFSIVLCFGTVYAQSSDTTSLKKELTAKAVQQYQQGNLDEAIKSAEKVVKLEETSNPADSVSYANSLINLARIQRDVFLVLKTGLVNGKIEPGKRAAARKKAFENAKQADDNFRRAVILNEQNGRGETTQTADATGELGELVYDYAGSRQSIDDSEKFFLKSLELNEKLRGKNDDKTLAIVLKTGNFYFEMDNYEKALPFYERYIRTGEAAYGSQHPTLMDALRPMATILLTTFQEKEAADALKRIETITKKPEAMPKTDLNFHLRSKNSVAFNSKNALEIREGRQSVMAMLRAQGRTLTRSNIDLLPEINRVSVRVLVDDDGKILEAVAESGNDKLRSRAVKEVLNWTVRPFIYNGVAHKMRGYLTYSEIK